MGPTVLLLLLLLAGAGAGAAATPEPPATRCAAAIVSISPCLAHLAVVALPAEAAAAPTAACCAAFLRAVSPGGGGGGDGCFCHLVREPLLLGFPIDAARLGSLFPTCAARNASAAATVEAAALFAETCQESKTLPPMHSPHPSAPKASPVAAPLSVPSAAGLSTDMPRDQSGAAVTVGSSWLLPVALMLAAVITLEY